MDTIVIGIDLGTTNSVVAVLEGGQPRVVPTAEGGHLCPSVISITPSGVVLVGEVAKRQLLTHPDRTIASIKRHIGTDYTVKIDEKTYTPPELSALILQKLKADVEAQLGQPVEKAVITVPAYFNDSQRQATKEAGGLAGLDVIRIVNEPTAAALAYGLDRKQTGTVLVWDLGGGTFDVSILTLGDGIFQVLSTSGDTHLGGDDWDQALAQYLLNVFRDQQGIDLTNDRTAQLRLKDAAETAKIQLSTAEETSITLPFLAMENEQPKHLEMQITRREFEALTGSLRERMIQPTTQALFDAHLDVGNLDAVILVGGSTRMPAVQRLAQQILTREAEVDVNPDEVVAVGAAIQGGIISGEFAHMVLLDVTPLSLGIETANGAFVRIIAANTTIPTREMRTFTTSRNNQRAVDVHVLQGERDIAAQNKSLGRFSLRGIRPAPRGVPRIDVTFDIDENGIVHVSAVDQSTGNTQDMQVTAKTELTKEEIESMFAEAKDHADADRQALEIVELRKQGDTLLETVTKRLDQVGDTIPINDLAKIDKAILRMRKALETGEAHDLRVAIDELQDLNVSLMPLDGAPARRRMNSSLRR